MKMCVNAAAKSSRWKTGADYDGKQFGGAPLQEEISFRVLHWKRRRLPREHALPAPSLTCAPAETTPNTLTATLWSSRTRQDLSIAVTGNLSFFGHASRNFAAR